MMKCIFRFMRCIQRWMLTHQGWFFGHNVEVSFQGVKKMGGG